MTKNLAMVVATMTAVSVLSVHAAQKSASAAAAKNLISALDDAHLDAIAAVDPAAPGAFVAALYIKSGQLLVVRAQHPSAEALAARLSAHQFRDVYIDLQATPTSDGKLFVMDSGADGLPSDSDQPAHVDVIYEDGTRQTMFNGARAQQLSSDAYEKQLQDADVKYTRLLEVLNAAVAARSRAFKSALSLDRARPQD